MRIAIYANDYETVIQISELLDYFMKRMMVEADIDCLSIEKKEEILINSSQEKYDLIYLDLQTRGPAGGTAPPPGRWTNFHPGPGAA